LVFTGADRQWAGQYEPGDMLRYNARQQGAGHRSGRIRACWAREQERQSGDGEASEPRAGEYDPRRSDKISDGTNPSVTGTICVDLPL